GQIKLGSVESEPIDMQTLGAQIEAFAANHGQNERTAYIASSHLVDTKTLDQVLEQLRKSKIETVRLLVSDVERRRAANGIETIYDKTMGDIPAPNRIFKVNIRNEVYGNNNPNPLTLVVSDCGGRSKVCLNNSDYDNTDQLGEQLIEIFRNREQNGVFRIGTN